MTFILGLLINLLIVALIIAIVFWVLSMFADTIPANILKIIRAIIILIALVWVIQILLGGASGVYPVPALHR